MKVKGRCREKEVESEELADKGTSPDEGKEMHTGCMEGNPPLRHKLKKLLQAKSENLI